MGVRGSGGVVAGVGVDLSGLSSEAKQEVASEAVKGRRSYLRTNRMHQAAAAALGDEDQLCANV